jgi:hypothetical protein
LSWNRRIRERRSSRVLDPFGAELDDDGTPSRPPG